MIGSLATSDRCPACGFDVVKQRVAALFLQKQAELLAEQMHVAPQPGILGLELDAFPV